MHIDDARVRDYVAATGDDLQLYEEAQVAPSLAVAAFALGALLESVSLPAGSLHASENVTFKAPVPIDAQVEISGKLASLIESGAALVTRRMVDDFTERLSAKLGGTHVAGNK